MTAAIVAMLTLFLLGLVSQLRHWRRLEADRADVARRLSGLAEDRQGRRWLRRVSRRIRNYPLWGTPGQV